MLVIALCSVLTGGADCTDMAEFAEAKLGFLRGFLKPNFRSLADRQRGKPRNTWASPEHLRIVVLNTPA
jgi:hypothetical protein